MLDVYKLFTAKLWVTLTCSGEEKILNEGKVNREAMPGKCTGYIRILVYLLKCVVERTSGD